ncbi:hypothetical protein [Saccharibacillus sp. JS10]|nr:hypothetical protein [Saccharibacillus sp. JS10]
MSKNQKKILKIAGLILLGIVVLTALFQFFGIIFSMIAFFRA